MSVPPLKIVVLYDAGADAGFNKPGEIAPEEDIRPVAEDVASCIRRLGYDTVILPALPPIEVTAERIRLQAPDLIFNLCEGFNSDSDQEGNVAGMLDVMRIPYTGNSARTLHVAIDKAQVKAILHANGIRTPKWFLAKNPFFKWKRQVPFPVIVKPQEEDASVGIDSGSVVGSVREIRARVEMIGKKHAQPSIVEHYIDGREFNVALLDGELLEVSEIDFTKFPRHLPRIVTYRAKWDEKSDEFRGTVPVCPAKIPKRLREEAATLARRCWEVLRGRDYARVDMRMARDGKLYVLEFNPNPDFSRDAGFARCARAAGKNYPQLVAELVRLAAKRIKSEVPKTAATTQA